MTPVSDDLAVTIEPARQAGMAERVARVACLGITGALAVVGIEWIVLGAIQLGPGLDYGIYMDRAADFLAGRGFYLPRQLDGPYVVLNGDALYPPPSLLLFVPFVYLPAVLWWAIPLGIIAAIVVHHRPAMWSWPLMAACTVAGPGFAATIVKGNPLMWIGAAVAVATIWRPAAVLVLLKPSLFPFALFGTNRRDWWVVLGVCGLVSLAFLPMWPDWFRAVTNVQEGSRLVYGLSEAPFLLVPLLAWLGRRR